MYFLGGAWDGELESNTLLLELHRNWRGLLIEPNKQNFVNMVKKHRKTMMVETCLSMNNKYELIEFLNLVRLDTPYSEHNIFPLDLIAPHKTNCTLP